MSTEIKQIKEDGSAIWYGVIAVLLILGISARLLPHPANFAPIGAIAMFSALYVPRRFALVVPVIALFISDIVIGLYDWRIMVAVYGSSLVMGVFGLIACRRRSVTRVLGYTLLGSLAFFFITNAAVWLFGTMYPHTLSGLMESYVMAIPFFRNSIAGDIFYTAILVGAAEGAHLAYQGRTLILQNKQP